MPLLAALLASLPGCDRLGPPRFRGTPLEPARPAPDFVLTDHAGRRTRLSEHRGHPVVLFFGYTHCPDLCPLTLERLQRMRSELGARGEALRILLISVDPARDTPERMARYVRNFGPGVIGLTGSPAELALVRRAYGAYVTIMPAAQPSGQPHAGHHPTPGGPARPRDALDLPRSDSSGPLLGHIDGVYGIDREGRWRVIIAADAPERDFRADLRTLTRL